MSGGGTSQVNPRGMPSWGGGGWHGNGGGWNAGMTDRGIDRPGGANGGMTDRGIDRPGGFNQGPNIGGPNATGNPTQPSGPITAGGFGTGFGQQGPQIGGPNATGNPVQPNGPMWPAPQPAGGGAPPGFNMPPVNMGNFNPATYGNFNNIFRGNTGMWGGGYGGGGLGK